MKVLVRHKRTGEEYEAYLDLEGLWISDPADPGYVDEKDWEVIK